MVFIRQQPTQPILTANQMLPAIPTIKHLVIFVTHTITEGFVFVAKHAHTVTHATDATKTIMGESTVPKIQRPLSDLGFKPLPLTVEDIHVNIKRFSELLKGHPDGPLVQYILHGLRHGFNIGFKGTLDQSCLKNNKSARDNPDLKYN